MKILLLTTHLNVGGISSYLVNLSNGLRLKGIKVIVASGGGALEDALEREGIGHYYLDIKTKSELSPKIIKAVFRLIGIIKKEKIDLIHAQTRITQVIAALVSKIIGVPYISTCHGFYKFRLNRKLFPCFGEVVIAVSRQVKDELENKLYIDQNKIRLIPHGIDIEKYSKAITLDEKNALKKKLNLKEDSFVLGSIGRFAPEKGHSFLISAFSLVANRHPNAELILVGEGRLKRDLLSQAKGLNLEGKIHFLGERYDLENIYPVMDVFCFPSLRESFGFSVLEALASGVVVVASNIGELKYLIEEGKNGFLCEPANPEALALKLNYLIENRDLLTQMSIEAKKITNKDFSIFRMAEDTIAVYKEAIKWKES